MQYRATGRRKKSIARVRLVDGNGNITVNGRDVNEYFDFDILIQDLKRPLQSTNLLSQFDVFVNVHGGGYTGQAGAIRHGIARAIVEFDSTKKKQLKDLGYIKRDSRMKERKKYGFKKARKSPQFSKR